jgi:predicted transcriptional regulator
MNTKLWAGRINNVRAEKNFRQQVDAGLKELDNGKWISHEEMEKRISKWLMRYGSN